MFRSCRSISVCMVYMPDGFWFRFPDVRLMKLGLLQPANQRRAVATMKDLRDRRCIVIKRFMISLSVNLA